MWSNCLVSSSSWLNLLIRLLLSYSARNHWFDFVRTRHLFSEMDYEVWILVLWKSESAFRIFAPELSSPCHIATVTMDLRGSCWAGALPCLRTRALRFYLHMHHCLLCQCALSQWFWCEILVLHSWRSVPYAYRASTVRFCDVYVAFLCCGAEPPLLSEIPIGY